MADIAELGFKADTSKLEKTVKTLDKLSATAKGTSNSVTILGRSIGEANRLFAVAAGGMGRVGSAVVNAAKSITGSQKQINSSVSATNRAIEKQIADLTLLNRINRTTGVTGLSGKSAKESASVFQAATIPARDQRPNRFNTANIAAQFQDIGVTAVAGFSPFTIALQQGTQLSAILNSMESPLKGIKVAFTQIFNPISLISIALVALVAVGIQFINLAETGKSVLNGLASVIEFISPLFLQLTQAVILATTAYVGFRIALLTLNLRQTVLGVVALSQQVLLLSKNFIQLSIAATVAGTRMATAWITATGPIGVLTAAILGAIAVAGLLGNKIKEAFGVDVVSFIRDAVNNIVGFVVGLVQGSIAALGNIKNTLKGEGKSTAEVFNTAFQQAMEKDFIGGIEDLSKRASRALRRVATSVGGGSSTSDFEELIQNAQRRLTSLQAEQQSLGLTAEATSALKFQTDLLNEAQRKNIELTPQQTEQIRKLAQEMGRIDAATKRTKEFLDLGKESLKGFFRDMRIGLVQGASLWDTFANSVGRILDNLIDKFLGIFLDAAFTSIFPQKAGPAFAKGASFDNQGVKKFAKGGSFTNSIVNKTTPFKFANGGEFGVMGEAGPEAILPLERGPDGSLGVKNFGNGNSSSEKPTVNVEVIVNGNADVQQETQTLGDGSELRRFIINTVNEANASGSFDSSNAGRFGLTPRKGVR